MNEKEIKREIANRDDLDPATENWLAFTVILFALAAIVIAMLAVMVEALR